MPDDLTQQATIAGSSGVIGAILTAVVTAIRSAPNVKQQDVQNFQLEIGKQMADLKSEIAEKYVQKDAFQSLMDRMNAQFDRLHDLILSRLKDN